MNDMKRTWTVAAARRLRTVLVVGAALAAAANHAAWATNDQAPAASGGANRIREMAPATPQPAAKPLWNELTQAQQQALAPLASEWDQLEASRKNKWLAIGNKFATMTPDERQRVQERMRDWVKLTPEQRRMARESYARAKKLHPEQKSARWEQYQQLPEDQKKKLAANAPTKKPVTTLRPPASESKSKPIPPIKSAPKPVLERSVTPQAAGQSALQASPQSTK